MAHALIKLTETLYNKPHLITPDSFDRILSYLEDRNNGNIDLSVLTEKNLSDREEREHLQYNPDTLTGVIDIEGPLTYKTTGWEMLCGGASYESIVSQFNTMASMGAKTIILMNDSGGGQAYGMFEAGRLLRSRSDELGIHLISYVDGMSASASYGLSASAHEIIMNPEAEVGSIGVVMRLMNDSEHLKKEGYERTFIYAGKNKIPFDAEGKFSKDFLADLQEGVDITYDKFVSYVAEMRGIDKQTVIDTEARMFRADQALSIGLADKVMTHIEFMEYQASFTTGERKVFGKQILGKQASQSTKETEVEMKQLEELQASYAALEAKHTEKEAELASVAASLSETKEQLEQANAQVEQLTAQIETAKLDARKEKINAVVADKEQQASLFEATKGMDEAGFAVVLSTLSAKEQLVAKSDMFKEIGANGDHEEASDRSLSLVTKKIEASKKQ